MKHTLAGFLLAGATCAFVLATPALAQVAGNPGDLHTPTPYTSEIRANTYGAAPGYGGPLGPISAITSPFAAVNGVPSGGACGVNQDFNGRLTALCGL
jgi:hypothetical protein